MHGSLLVLRLVCKGLTLELFVWNRAIREISNTSNLFGNINAGRSVIF